MDRTRRTLACLVILFVVFFSGCATPADVVPESVSRAAPATAAAPASAHTIRIASWNIENFGRTKATDPERMRAIASILKNYDIIAVQEISNVKELSDPGCPRNEQACPGDPNCGLIGKALDKYLNQENGLHYRFAFSPQVKDERYLFIYNPDKVALEGSNLVADPVDSLPICDASPASTGLMVSQDQPGGGFEPPFSFRLFAVDRTRTACELALSPACWKGGRRESVPAGRNEPSSRTFVFSAELVSGTRRPWIIGGCIS